ncbi:uncharacterized protein LOC143961066 [Lithobates pipiens]
MAFSWFWTVATMLLLRVLKVNSNSPTPVLSLPENISEDEDINITCTLPCTDCLDVNLTIKADVKFKSCTFLAGKTPNVTCILEVTREMDEKEFTCEAQFKIKSLPKKLYIQKPSPNKSGRRKPVLATILEMLMATSFFLYLF